MKTKHFKITVEVDDMWTDSDVFDEIRNFLNNPTNSCIKPDQWILQQIFPYDETIQKKETN